MYQENFIQLIEARIEKFKKEGLTFSAEDGKDRDNIEVFEGAFTKFINDGTQDEVQSFIAQIPHIRGNFDLLQNNDGGTLCASILCNVKDVDRSTNAMQALFDAGINPVQTHNGYLFFYSDDLNTGVFLSNRSSDEVSKFCLPYFKGILFSKKYAKFTEAVEKMHLGRSVFITSDSNNQIRPDFISTGIEAASEYLHDNSVVGKEILKPFYDNLTDPQSVLGKYCIDSQLQAKENREELQRLDQIIATGNRGFFTDWEYNATRDKLEAYEMLQERVKIFKYRFQSIYLSLENLTLNTINGIVKDKKSIEELPIPTVLKNNLNKGYMDTFHPGKREAYNQEYSKSDKLSKFMQPQISSNSDGHTANNKTESKHDQTNNKSTIRRKTP